MTQRNGTKCGRREERIEGKAVRQKNDRGEGRQ